ncbi:dockerin type I domain-containing protein [Ruminiclostridium cellulolyticum]|uniref:cellulase n=1 Tax=Ruminiclostridium cellulolyticum (strain ATCC 35319 / DSM 5812 / JCM 6584 / H10) TaxID=394503 RepID=B8I7W0_RUMCH|nr:cellulosome protein dockerin type I [Ruminiclostridium cellulolyticum H10]
MRKKIFMLLLALLQVALLTIPQQLVTAASARQMEYLDRGIVAVKVSNGVFVSWRMLGTDSTSIAFNLYRDGKKVNTTPITSGTNYVDTTGTASSTYYVCPVKDGVELAKSESTAVWGQNYLSLPLQIPAGGTTKSGEYYTYSANDCSVGDLDGDGQYEIILKWDPSNAKDNSQSGYTGNVYLDAYKLNGKFLWRIDLGRNIRAGAHYTQFMVYDLDGDGKAEVACKTADGTKDGIGKVIGNANADYTNSNGYILSGPEYLTIFNGETGAALTTTDYDPPRGTVSSWGDSYGNRVDRFLACIAYLDGVHPSLVMCRGYYTRAVLAAYNWRDGKLTKVWTFDSKDSGNSAYEGQGNHNLSVGDVDSDGMDEIVYGACAIDHNGRGLYTTKLNHGDAMHLSDMDPGRPGLEVWQCHETGSNASSGEYRDARTGQLIWGLAGTSDTGRGLALDIDPRYKGFEMWSSSSDGVYNVNGTKVSTTKPSMNFGVWWDGDLNRELLDGTKLDKWDYVNSTPMRLLTPADCASNNSTKANPCLSADILGDWREEVIWRTTDNKYLRIYTTTAVTSNRIYTLMHDPLYRLSIAWQNVAYNQPPHTGFYLGDGMSQAPTPNIYIAKPASSFLPGDVNNDGSVDALDFAIVKKYLLGQSTELDTGKADMNSDGDINALDLALLKASLLS